MRPHPATRVALAVAAVFCASGARPAEFERGEAGDGARPPAAEIAGIRVECRAGEVVALRQGAEIWRILHPSLVGRREGGERPVGPAAFGGRLFYGTGCYVLEVDVTAGRVLRRYVFADAVKSLSSGSAGVRTVYGRTRDRYSYDAEFLLRPGGPEPPLFLSGDPPSALVPLRDAVEICRNAGVVLSWWTVEPGATPANDASARARALRLLAEQVSRDPTNPFLEAASACILRMLGREEEAASAAARASELEGNARIMLMHASSWLEEPGFSEAAERAFEIGYRVFLDSGHEPEQFTSIIALMRHCGCPARAMRDHLAAGRLDEAGRLMRRMWRVAPVCEGSALAWAGMAEAYQEAGRPVEAELWRRRAGQAGPSLVFGGAHGGYFDYASQGINAMWAIPAAAVLYAAVLLSRFVGNAIRGRRGRERADDGRAVGVRRAIRRHLSAREVVAAGLLGAAGYAAFWFSWVGAVATRTAGSLDLASSCGSWGSTASLMDWSRLVGNEEGRELHALALVQAGRLDEARAILQESCRSAEARNNLGVVLARKGCKEEARAAFLEALATDGGLQEALYNLGRPAAGHRVERAAAYTPGRPLLAMPRPGTVARALVGVYDGYLALTSPPYLLTSNENAVAKTDRVAQMLLQLTCVALIVALLTVRVAPPRLRRGGAWWLGLGVPGTARAYAPLGPLVLAGYLYCAVLLACDAAEHGSGATSVLEAINLPNVKAAFGISASPMHTWRGSLIAASKWYVVLVALANVAGVLLWTYRHHGEFEGDDAPRWWSLARGGLIALLGLSVSVRYAGLGFQLLGATIALSGVASALVAPIAHRCAQRAGQQGCGLRTSPPARTSRRCWRE